MFAASRILLVMALGLGFSSNSRADDKKPMKTKPAAELWKPLVIQIDASKLPPEVLRQLLAEKPTDKPGAKPTEPVKPGTKPAGDKFVKPVVKPGEKVTKPDLKPSEKVTKPDSQDEKVTKPDLKPSEKVTKPDLKPSEKVTKPDSQDEIIQRLDKLSIQIEQLRKSIEK